MMLSCGLTPDAPTAALVLAAALQAGRPEKAFALAQSLQVRCWRPRLAAAWVVRLLADSRCTRFLSRCPADSCLTVSLPPAPPSCRPSSGCAKQVQGVQLDPEVQAQLLHTCVAAGAWDLALQLCSAALLAQARGLAGQGGAGRGRGCCSYKARRLGPLATCHATLPPTLQGSTAAPLFNFVLHSAAGARQFGAVVQALTAMRAAGLEVDPGVAAQVRRRLLAAWAAALAGCLALSASLAGHWP